MTPEMEGPYLERRSVLDIEGAGGTSRNAAVTIDWSLKKLDYPDPVCLKIIDMQPDKFQACYFILNPLSTLQTYKSKNHDTAIDIHEMTTLFTSKLQYINFSDHETIRIYPQATEEIACGARIFDNFASNTIKALLQYVEDRFYSLLYNIHHIKSMVKDPQLVKSTKRLEFFRYLYAIIRSAEVHNFNQSEI